MTLISQYFPVLVFMILAIGFGVVPAVAGALIGPRRPYHEKQAPYECGFDAFEDARIPFDVRFYLVAILFIIFDLETAFLFPWAVSVRHLGATGWVAMAIFIGILVVGFIYEWRRGALEWE